MPKRRLRVGEWLREYRVYVLLIVVYLVMAIFAPRFLTVDNQIALLKKMSIHVLPAIGFTLVLAVGQLDLSFATVMTLGGMLTMGFQPKYGWIGAVIIGVASGAAIGYVNGLLVAKAKVSSFIVTLSTMTIVQGLVLVYCKGNTLNVDDYSILQWFDKRSLFAPPIVFALLLTVTFDLILQRTRYGRNLLITGGNPLTAWNAGLNTNRPHRLGVHPFRAVGRIGRGNLLHEKRICNASDGQ